MGNASVKAHRHNMDGHQHTRKRGNGYKCSHGHKHKYKHSHGRKHKYYGGVKGSSLGPNSGIEIPASATKTLKKRRKSKKNKEYSLLQQTLMNEGMKVYHSQQRAARKASHKAPTKLTRRLSI
jgi:hypothetical protein